LVYALIKFYCLKRFFKFSLVIIIVFIGSIYYFFKVNNAPILQGEVKLCMEYQEGLLLDIYLPTKMVYKKTPVLLYYHGGAWISGRKETVNNARFNEAFNQLREKGYAVVSPEYTLGEFGQSPFPDCITDTFDAIAWIEENADKYNFDLQNIGVLGESAGGHLALMTAFADAENFNSKIHVPMQYVVAAYPPTDLAYLYKEQRFILDSINMMAGKLPTSIQKIFDGNQYLFGFDPEQDSLRTQTFTKKYSPITYISDKQIPTLILHGNSDRVVPFSQSKILIEKLQQEHIPYEYHFLENVDHAFMGATDAQKAQVQEWIVDFVIRKYWKPSEASF